MGSEGILQFGMKGKKSTEKIKFGNFGGKKGEILKRRGKSCKEMGNPAKKVEKF